MSASFSTAWRRDLNSRASFFVSRLSEFQMTAAMLRNISCMTQVIMIDAKISRELMLAPPGVTAWESGNIPGSFWLLRLTRFLIKRVQSLLLHVDFSTPINTHFIFKLECSPHWFRSCYCRDQLRHLVWCCWWKGGGASNLRMGFLNCFSCRCAQHRAAFLKWGFRFLKRVRMFCPSFKFAVNLWWFCVCFLEYSNSLQKHQRGNNSLIFLMCFQGNQ